MLRRPKLRSKSGCFTCRRRKKKCDESSYPNCRNCTSNKLQCSWPDHVVTDHRMREPESTVSIKDKSPADSPTRPAEMYASPLIFNAVMSEWGISKPENKGKNYILQRISMQQDCVEETENSSRQLLVPSNLKGPSVEACPSGRVSSIRDRIARQLDISGEEINKNLPGQHEADSEFRTI